MATVATRLFEGSPDLGICMAFGGNMDHQHYKNSGYKRTMELDMVRVSSLGQEVTMTQGNITEYPD